MKIHRRAQTQWLRLLATLGLLIAGRGAWAQQLYSSSAEYQQMMTELRQPAPSPAFIATGRRPQADPALRFKVYKSKQSLRIDTASLALSIDTVSQAITLTNLRTQSVWVLTQPKGTSCAAATPATATATEIHAGHKTFMVASATAATCSHATVEILDETTARVTYSRNAGSTERDLPLHVAGTLPLFGLGERFWQAGLRGTSLEVRPADKSGEPGHAWVYVAVPFVFSPGGLGFYADTVFDSKFRFNPEGSAFDVDIVNQPVSLYLMAGAGPKEMLTAYTGITGRPQNPPLWTFGPWINAVQGKGAVLDLAEKIRTEGIPASALWMFDEMDEPHNLGWPFWFSSYYGDPRAFNDTLHAQGFRVLNYVHPYVREQMLPYPSPSPAYQKGVREKLLMTGPDGLPAGPRFEPVRTGNIDFTNPAAVDWWQSMITSAVRYQQWDGWMEDFGEWIADDDSFAAGKGDTIAEVYPLLYHKITIRIAESLNPAMAPFSRSGSSGSQQFSPVLWGADQQHNWSRDYGLPSVITAGITAGMAGYSTWGPDILSDGDSKELWMRWAEFGALSPVMRDHVWSKPQYSVDAWSDADTQGLFKKYAILHSALLPYFATYAAEAHRDGVPIMRHTMLEYPTDARSYNAEYQYFLGDDLLIAPVIEPGATQRTLYLPPGEWVNYWSGERYPGGRNATVPAPLDQIPILVRAGSVLPFKPEAETHSLEWTNPQLLSGSLVWRVFPGSGEKQDSVFTLPDQTSAHFQYSGGQLSVDGVSSLAHVYEIILPAQSAPAAVSLGGQPVAVVQPTASQPQPDGWWYDVSSHQVHVVVRAANFQLVISKLR
jgi:alpha-D-xyloside xylohydrolase